jgi:purine-binding chemotaxis protein CheW
MPLRVMAPTAPPTSPVSKGGFAMSTTAAASLDRSQEQQFLTFFLVGEEYAIPILKVREIIEYDTVTVVPSTPPWIRGVINLRGTVVPVVDLAVKFGMPPTQPTKLTCNVVVEVEYEGQKTTTGIMADSVSQVVKLRPSDIETVPSFGTKIRVDYLLGMGKAGRKFVLLLDIDRALASTEIIAAKDSGAAQSLPSAETGVPGN